MTEKKGLIYIEKRIQYFGRLTDLLFPRRCPFCDRILPLYLVQDRKTGTENRKQNRRQNTGKVCAICEKKLIFAEEPVCKKCGKPLTDDRKEYCEDCMRVSHVFTQGRALLSYQDGVRQSLYRFKYSNKREYADYYAEKIWQIWGKWVEQKKIDLIAAVPLYAKKERKRGYNQAWILAKRISRVSKIPAKRHCLARIRETFPQKNLTRMQRKKNLGGAFLAEPALVSGKRILLVDDIYTTGSTVDEAAKALLLAGSLEIYVLTAAIGG